jgi:hypothetical protein
MASLAQILANRRNAEKSTGPQTPEGKAASSQNAVKHGLLARQDVIRTEDQGEFDSFREQMLAELNPAGPMETVLAERIVSLSWRLKRVERMQNEALDCLLAQDTAGPGTETAELGSFVQTADPDGGDPALALGRVVVKDFANERALDRLLVYERRIEHSLYRTMSELHRMKLLRPFDADDRGRRPEPLVRDSGVSSFKCEVSSGGLPASNFTLDSSRQTPHGVTANAQSLKRTQTEARPVAAAGAIHVTCSSPSRAWRSSR